MMPQMFEKDDDTNGHIDYITAAAVSTFDFWQRHIRDISWIPKT